MGVNYLTFRQVLETMINHFGINGGNSVLKCNIAFTKCLHIFEVLF